MCKLEQHNLNHSSFLMKLNSPFPLKIFFLTVYVF